MKELLKNIKETFARLFGFKQPQQPEEWGNDYLEKLVEKGEVTPDAKVAFKESDKTRAELLERLEYDDSKPKEAKGGTKSGKQKEIKTKEQSDNVVVTRTKNKGLERE